MPYLLTLLKIFSLIIILYSIPNEAQAQLRNTGSSGSRSSGSSSVSSGGSSRQSSSFNRRRTPNNSRESSDRTPELRRTKSSGKRSGNQSNSRSGRQWSSSRRSSSSRGINSRSRRIEVSQTPRRPTDEKNILDSFFSFEFPTFFAASPMPDSYYSTGISMIAGNNIGNLSIDYRFTSMYNGDVSICTNDVPLVKMHISIYQFGDNNRLKLVLGMGNINETTRSACHAEYVLGSELFLLDSKLTIVGLWRGTSSNDIDNAPFRREWNLSADYEFFRWEFIHLAGQIGYVSQQYVGIIDNDFLSAGVIFRIR